MKSMQRIVARIGGTSLERLVLNTLFSFSSPRKKEQQAPGAAWVNERIHPVTHQSQLQLRTRLLEFESAFAVPVSYWQVAPIGIRSNDLGKFLEWLHSHPDFELRWLPGQPNNIEPLTAETLKSRQIFNEVKKGKRTIYVCERSSELATGVPIEVWKKTSKGNFTSPGWNGSISEIGASATDAALLSLDQNLAQMSIHDVPFDVDAVYLWVDGSDPKWLEKKRKFSAEADSHGTSDSRFTSRNELYFSIATLLKNAPWVNRIWLVTDGQTPDLGDLADRVTVVDHESFIPKEFLPTFNSHVITAHLHRIEGLAENFLYLNDDILFGRPLIPSAWFDSHGRCLIRYTRTTLPGFSVADADVIHLARQHTVQKAIAAGLQISMRSIQHGPHPMRKSTMQQMWVQFGDELKATSANRFRTEADLVPEWLHNFLAYGTGQAVMGGKLTYSYIVLNAKSSLAKIANLALRRPPSVICLNDVSEIAESDRASEQITEYRLTKIAALLLKA
jgi:hypothetical protein